ncbi:ammonia-forming cytochrome c nitrite reductase subunit c552, partial [Actinotignum timonense]|uniref:ammonia-forming cytochrome c nitrite reductase subunit c552 n=2 Tax=Actinomycetaceae TaxID=2049 RepID=UPI00254A71D0|nr:ammonia-forming cytochrome c nitrite reductase subunit c552 [Actinotignum timonense]
VTRPAFINGIKALKKHEGVKNFDPNKDATNQEMRTYVCAQCHVEYYFKDEGDGRKTLTFPWDNGTHIDQIYKYYEDRNFV